AQTSNLPHPETTTTSPQLISEDGPRPLPSQPILILQRPTTPMSTPDRTAPSPRPTPPMAEPSRDALATTPNRASLLATAGRFASPPATLRRSTSRTTDRAWTLGDFLAAATKQIRATLPASGKRPRRTLNFNPRRGRSATAACSPTTVPLTAERRAHVQILRTLGIVGTDQ
uniref:Uncharacterized protein n=1 Tax=Aegilops tauschii subsp. strangulata TaxID=200361 RepID=A0A453BHE9_AEGTS